MIKLVSFLTGRKIVYLKDIWGELYETLEYKNPIKDPFTGQVKSMCPVFWLTGVGEVILNKDGTTGGDSCYIKQWMYADEIRP